MKTIPKIGLTLLVASLVFSCKDAVAIEESPSMQESVEANSEVAKTISSSAAVEPTKSNRKVIRKADIKFKVKNVPKSTYAIEDAATKFGGFVTYTNLQSNISEKNETKVSQDSTLETTKYSVENNIII